MRFPAKKKLSIISILLLLVVSLSVYFVNTPKVHAALLASSQVQLSDPRPSTATTYTISFTDTTTSIKCFDVIFADATSHITLVSGSGPTTTAPTGMTTTGAAKGSPGVSGGGLTDGNWTGYFTNNGILQLENSSGAAPSAGTITLTFTTVTNPSVGTFYAQVATYNTVSTHQCTGLVDNSNVMALATTGGVTTTVTVDPTISFSVAGASGAVNGGPTSDPITTASSIGFGNVSAGGSATSAAQLLTTSTNAANGYYIYIRQTQSLTDAATDTIRDMTSTPGSPASFDGSTSQSAFGFTTNSTTVSLGSNQWAGLTTTNVSIDHQTAPQNAKTLNVEYQLQLKNTQPPGTYSNVITYTASPVY